MEIAEIDLRHSEILHSANHSRLEVEGAGIRNLGNKLKSLYGHPVDNRVREL